MVMYLESFYVSQRISIPFYIVNLQEGFVRQVISETKGLRISFKGMHLFK